MTFRYNNINVNITVAGEGEPILLLHGWGCTGEIFKNIQAVLATAYKTYSFDFPGFGASDEPTEVWGVEEYTRMVEAFVKENGIERPALMGHSFGGRVSIVFASRNEVSRVVLVDVGLNKDDTASQ